MVAEKALEHLGAKGLKEARDLLLEMDESKLEVIRSKGYDVYFAKVGKAGIVILVALGSRHPATQPPLPKFRPRVLFDCKCTRKRTHHPATHLPGNIDNPAYILTFWRCLTWPLPLGFGWLGRVQRQSIQSHLYG